MCYCHEHYLNFYAKNSDKEENSEVEKGDKEWSYEEEEIAKLIQNSNSYVNPVFMASINVAESGSKGVKYNRKNCIIFLIYEVIQVQKILKNMPHFLILIKLNDIIKILNKGSKIDEKNKLCSNVMYSNPAFNRFKFYT